MRRLLPLLFAAAAGLAAPAATAAAAASDRAALASSLMTVLERQKTGTTHAWHNPATGASGTITVLRTFTGPEGVPCRDYRTTLKTPRGAERAAEGTACRAGRFEWILNDRAAMAPDVSVAPAPALPVREVQARLRQLGYDPGPVDGVYGDRTRRAIEAFQRDHGLVADGRIDNRLIEALRTDAAARTAAVRSPSSAAVGRDRGTGPWRGLDRTVAVLPKTRELDAAEAYRRVNQSVWVVVAGNPDRFRRDGSFALGSAVAVDERHLLTNCHIMAGMSELRIFQDDDVRRARLVAADPAGDRCILESTEGALQPVPGVRAFADLDVGERVYTIGAPGGLERTLGEGIISGLRGRDGQNYVQTTAPISRGSSGGGLFDVHGNLIGITTEYVGGGQLLNFAIAADEFWR